MGADYCEFLAIALLLSAGGLLATFRPLIPGKCWPSAGGRRGGGDGEEGSDVAKSVSGAGLGRGADASLGEAGLERAAPQHGAWL